ncbi:serum response factor-binding protein 1 [Salminus brasiliensis]|uniref:serum response factor-binding protein 1 n=1 Tax=Salminus brasiliensis TaxID=930266 RepID=UPI003B82D957
MPAPLNLSNEVVKMRAEVKRVKVLVIRKLTRQIAVLKKKKGKEADLEKNQRRAARLHEEIKELKVLAPDTITKAALQKDISFEKVCQNEKASLSERATARIATYPDFSQKIQNLKKAIEAFGTERKSDAKAEKKTQKESKDIKPQSESELDSDDEGAEDEEDMEESGKSKDEEKSSETDSAPAEVVRMRKVVKKLRMLIIRKLTQDISSLRKMKGEESELKGYQESAAGLQKEVHVLRGLLPDSVTTRALQGNINVEDVLQDPESSPLERATARIATHPRFIKKLQAVRESIDEKSAKAAQTEETNKDREVTVADDSDSDVEGEESESEDDDGDEEEGEEDDDDGTASDDASDNTKRDDEDEKRKELPLNVIKGSDGVKPPEEALKANEGVTDPAVKTSANLKSISKTPAVTHSVPAKSKKAAPAGQHIQSEIRKAEHEEDEEESDLELSDGEQEKEYFDDSTEERFHKQSSQSEESDDDDFFLGKVSKLKKKKSATSGTEKKSEPKTANEVQSDKGATDKSREFKMQSVFCSTLSKSGGTSQKGQHHGQKPPRFQNQKKCPDGVIDVKPSWFKSQGPGTDRRPSAAGPRGPSSRMGKPEFTQGNKGAPGKPFRPPHHSQQALHPSWEASRKRKEQQSQITAFQGKKIKFDDDD